MGRLFGNITRELGRSAKGGKDLEEVRRAIKRHVLNKVREAALIIRFVDRARLDSEPKQRAVCRQVVLADEELEAVRQRPGMNRRIEPERG